MSSNAGKHALPGWCAAEYAAYWKWLTRLGGHYIDPEAEERATAELLTVQPGRGKHRAPELPDDQ